MTESASAPPDSNPSLVRYECPVELPEHKHLDIQPSLSTLTSSTALDLPTLLSILVPPRLSFRDGGRRVVEYPSSQSSTRFQVLQLQDELNATLTARQARTAGLCPLRASVFHALFSELIRQVAVDSPPRGVLLARLRDELEMREEGYRVLCDSGVRFGALKAQTNSTTITTTTTFTTTLKGEVEKLKREVELEKRAQTERRTAEAKRRAEEAEFLKTQGANLEKFLDSVKEEINKENNK